MGDRNHIKYSEEENESFMLCPETCPVIEAAFDRARGYEPPMDDLLAYVERHGGMKLDDRTKMLLRERMAGFMFEPLHELKKVVLHEGTFKLRLALIRHIEQVKGMEPGPSRFQGWIDGYWGMKRFREQRAQARETEAA